MPTPDLVDMTDPDSPYELGDTHLLPRTVAEEAKVSASEVYRHTKTERFTKAYAPLSPTLHPIQHERAYVVVEYDKVLHDYMQRQGFRTEWTDDDRERAQKAVSKMSLREASEKTGIPYGTLSAWASEGIIQARDVDMHEARKRGNRASTRVRRAQAYERQKRALHLKEQGKTRNEIADMMQLHTSTIARYLREEYSPPE